MSSGADRRGPRAGDVEEGQHHRGGEGRMVGDDGDLQIQLPSGLRQRRNQREALHHGMEDQRGEPDLGGDAQAGEPAAAQEARSEDAGKRLEGPGQGEPGGHPEQPGEPLRREHLRQQVEGDHAGGGREGERARPFEDRRPALRGERDHAAEQGGESGEGRGMDHRRHLSQIPRSSSTWSCTWYRVARRTSMSARSSAPE